MKAKLKEILGQLEKRRLVAPRRIPSAVLVPLSEKEGQWHLLFIRRTNTVRSHRGQISFPGGTMEASDRTLLETALRECCEEIGLSPGDVEVLGEMDDQVTTTSNYVVSPFVGVIPGDYRFRRNEDEVDEIIEVPVAALLEENRWKPATEEDEGRLLESYTYHYQGRIIWGATARILKRFLDLVVQAAPEG